ncbi:unnamed protein product [Meloidogyne enterolobii]|uniref:Uncharacterized protein n=2 Tax=Meloidogyne enterolobii TaxID=390850 RepID=A0A6V7WZ78_MELEN|nr:unnamed protein product [Meloidogyne enterolobii]
MISLKNLGYQVVNLNFSPSSQVQSLFKIYFCCSFPDIYLTISSYINISPHTQNFVFIFSFFIV